MCSVGPLEMIWCEPNHYAIALLHETTFHHRQAGLGISASRLHQSGVGTPDSRGMLEWIPPEPDVKIFVLLSVPL